MVFDYIDGAAGEGRGEELNRRALQDLRLEPRVLVNVENRDLGVRVFDHDAELPFGVSPDGHVQSLGVRRGPDAGADGRAAPGAGRRFHRRLHLARNHDRGGRRAMRGFSSISAATAPPRIRWSIAPRPPDTGLWC